MTDDVLVEPLTEEECLQIQHMASPLAYTLSGFYGGYVEFLDLRSEMVVFALSLDTAKVRGWLAEEPAALTLSMRREGRRWCEREKASLSGYQIDDVARYSWGQIQEMLPAALNGEHRQLLGAGPEDNAPRARKPANEGSNLTATLVDILRAWEKALNDDERTFVLDCMQYTVKVIAEEQGIPVTTCRSRMQSKLKKMARFLNNES